MKEFCKDYFEKAIQIFEYINSALNQWNDSQATIVKECKDNYLKKLKNINISYGSLLQIGTQLERSIGDVDRLSRKIGSYYDI